MHHLQRSKHITRADIVYSDSAACPLNRQTRGQMSHRRFRSIVRRLRLRHIDNRTRHAPDKDNAPRRLTIHKVLSDASSEEVSAVDVDTPELLHPIVGIVYGVVVFGESGGCDEHVDFTVGFDDAFYAVRD